MATHACFALQPPLGTSVGQSPIPPRPAQDAGDKCLYPPFLLSRYNPQTRTVPSE